ncbi:hypothetical protein KCM76_14455 [Zooshikella marina]|uniref:hypothetical protein n=1 Tax=Zooshikella ganghwensis TaxID=202772 RepID=UPI001BAFC047|nr:hypothetical protein [Zooshikella ganghwensis]MBU2707195.1 hypothetical protein [Zooshikella ganghwensis]
MVIFYITGVLILVAIYIFIDHCRMKKISHERGEPNICEYARSFDFRNVDTKIIREVWSEIQLSLGNYNGRPFPVKADDTFDSIYKMDPDDLDDIYWSVADRLGIDTENPEGNPYFNQIRSVRDLVMFLNHQPRIKKYNKVL